MGRSLQLCAFNTNDLAHSAQSTSNSWLSDKNKTPIIGYDKSIYIPSSDSRPGCANARTPSNCHKLYYDFDFRSGNVRRDAHAKNIQARLLHRGQQHIRPSTQIFIEKFTLDKYPKTIFIMIGGTTASRPEWAYRRRLAFRMCRDVYLKILMHSHGRKYTPGTFLPLMLLCWL